MSVLVVLTPAPARAADTSARATGASGLGDAAWPWALCDDSPQIVSQGASPPALWPRADSQVMVVPAQALAWIPVDLPKVPVGRLPAALAGLLEEALLEEADELHVALPPQAKPGRPATVAVMPRSHLQQVVQAAEAAGREIDRVVPAFAPCRPPRGHFRQVDLDGQGTCQLVWADERSVAGLPLQGDGARALVQQASEQATWSSTPAAAAAAEAWAGRPLPVVPEAQTWLDAAGSGWELRQFDLAPRHRGLRWGRDAWRRFRGPDWRPVRLGVAALVAVNVLGLHLWSWQQQQAVQARKQAQVALLKATHPQVRVVLDAPLQMQREADRLRVAAGQPGEADLEAALSAAAAAWPAGLGPPQALRYERGQLTLSAASFSPGQLGAMAEKLQPLGWAVEGSGGRLSMTRRGDSAGKRSPAP